MFQLRRKVGPAALFAVLTFLDSWLVTAAAGAAGPYISVGARTRTPPIGWTQFCETYSGVCNTKPITPVDVVLDPKAWADLFAIG
jgi:predicted transglutaminase-like cysteine proteinase